MAAVMQRWSGVLNRKALADLSQRVRAWFRDEWDHFDLFDETEVEQQKANPLYLVGPMFYLFWMVTVVSGLWLVIYYLPNTTWAYNSVHWIQHEAFLGWLFRGLHKYAADALIIAATIRVYRLYFTGEYKGKVLTWIVALLLLLFGMYSGLTGYLLIWNQRAFWATKVFATFPTYLDEINTLFPFPFNLLWPANLGKSIAQFMLGGTAIGPATITRFYAGHYAMSVVLLLLTEIYFLRRCSVWNPAGITRRINMSWVVALICVSMVILVSVILPVEQGRRANPRQTPLPILSDWYFLGLYQMMKEMKPFPATLGTVIIPLVVLLMPLFETLPWGRSHRQVRTWKRPFFFTVGMIGLVYWLIFSIMILANHAKIDTDPPKLWGSMIMFALIGWAWECRAQGKNRRQVTAWGLGLLAFWWLIHLYWFWWIWPKGGTPPPWEFIGGMNVAILVGIAGAILATPLQGLKPLHEVEAERVQQARKRSS